MKGTLALLFSSTVLFAQPVSFGFKAGVPMTDVLSAASGPLSHGTVSTSSDRFIVGPAVELHLPFGLGLEFDVLYRRFSYASLSSLYLLSNLSATGSNWEFPLLVKKHLLPGPARPFVDAGVNFDKLTGVSQTVQVIAGATAAGTQNTFSKGFTMGAGVDIHLLILHIAPELRYTRWGSQFVNPILPGGSISSNQNQAEFLVGFTF
jgi:hypothetical protein